MKIAFYTFGCKLNQCETEALAAHYGNQGFFIGDLTSGADLFFINTCTVTSKSEQKARRLIRALIKANPRSLIIVTGCYTQLGAGELTALGPNLILISQADKSKLLNFTLVKQDHPAFNRLELSARKQWFLELISGNQQGPAGSRSPDLFRFKTDKYHFHSRAFCKIQDGCNNRCAYCRVPLARGNSVSLEPEQVLQRCLSLEKAGYREIVLTGVNICSYNSLGLDLPGLLRRLLDSLSVVRIRLSSLEPEMVNEELAAVLSHNNICAHFHLPVQSGSDKILKSMKRRYTAAQVAKAVNFLTAAKPAAFLSGDMIVGFPGETAEDFRQTLQLAGALHFTGLHIFSFSPRPGTAAWEYKNTVPAGIRKQRSGQLQCLIDAAFQTYLAEFSGKIVEVILEKQLAAPGTGWWQGISGNYLKVRLPDHEKYAFKKGMLVQARIIKAAAVCEAELISIL